jgi:ElaB/YqjD/DUF883 family membrane-anchored ribosome-binding protein
MRWNKHWTECGALIAVAICCLLVGTAADAQSKKNPKQAESLEKAGESSRAAVRDVVDNLDKLLAGYNSIIDGEAKNPQSTYKKLVSDLKGTEKKIDRAKKQLTALDKEASKFFKDWEKDLESISSDSVREKSARRMEDAKQRYASMGEVLGQASQEFAPVVKNLNDQILFLGRDLSPEAVADLQDEAEQLNRQAAEVTARVKQMLESAGKTQHEADAALEGDEGDR